MGFADSSSQTSRGQTHRAHTGRRRNEEARQAILRSTVDLLMTSNDSVITMDGLAKAAGVSKQTIYRWWPNKAAVLAEAMSERARDEIPIVDTGTVLGDMTAFLIATFRSASTRPVARALQTVMAEAQTDPEAAEVLRTYTAARRKAMMTLLERGQQRGELPADAELSTLIDQAFGFVWYRMMVGHAPLSRSAAIRLAHNLLIPNGRASESTQP
jgi:AcrR family transcriptional regulator